MAVAQQVRADAGVKAKAAADALAAATAAANQEGLGKQTDEKQATDAGVTWLSAETRSTDNRLYSSSGATDNTCARSLAAAQQAATDALATTVTKQEAAGTSKADG